MRSSHPHRRFWRFLLYISLAGFLSLYLGHLSFTVAPVSLLDQELTPDAALSTEAPTTTLPSPIRNATVQADRSPFHDSYWPEFSTWKQNEGTWTFDLSNENTPFLSALMDYTQKGHDVLEIATLLDQTPDPNMDLTAVVRVTDNCQIKSQLQAITFQTRTPDTVWIICDFAVCPMVQSVVDSLPEPISMQIVVSDNIGWLTKLQTIRSDWIWLLEQDVMPSPKYLESTLRLLHTPEYENTLLGSQATLLPSNFRGNGDILCLPAAFDILPSITQPADMIHGSWVLRKSWIKYIAPKSNALPLEYHISQSLLRHANIPTIALPPFSRFELSMPHVCERVKEDYHSNEDWKVEREMGIIPTALDRRQIRARKEKEHLDTVLFFINGPEQAIALQPLMCRYQFAVHAVVTGRQRGLSGQKLRGALRATDCHNVVVHDIDLPTVATAMKGETKLATDVGLLLEVTQPCAIIYISTESVAVQTLQLVARSRHITAIGLPLQQVEHALWIAELEPEALRHWQTPEINLVIITDRRPHSLSRLLDSINRAYYLGDDVDLVIHLEQSSDRVTRMLVNDFHWLHGSKTLRHRIRKGGLLPAIVESWYPRHNHDYAVLLEDDVQVSPLFYVWAKYSLLQYRYTGNTDASRYLYGISLYSPRNVELRPEGRRPFHPDDVLHHSYPPRIPYVSQVPCSWGALYFPEHWREFHEYLTVRLLDEQEYRLLNITVPKSRSTRWKRSWKKYFIELVYLRAYVMLYPNFQSFESFSTNHLEMGTHVKNESRRLSTVDAFLVPLMQRDTILAQLPDHRLPSFEQLPVLDLWGYLKSLDELDATGANWHERVSACPRDATGSFDPQDLLCPMSYEKKEINIKPKKVKFKYAAEPIEYIKVRENDSAVVMLEQQEYWPEPIDVAIMPSEPEDGSDLSNDELEDILNNAEDIRRVYYELYPSDLQDVLAADAEIGLDD